MLALVFLGTALSVSDSKPNRMLQFKISEAAKLQLKL